MNKRWIVVMAVLIAAALGVLDRRAAVPETPINHALVNQPPASEHQRATTTLGLAGRVRSAQQVTLSAPFEAVISTLHVLEGQRVQAGQILLSLDSTHVQSQLRQAHAQWLKAHREALRLQHWSKSPEVARARRQVRAAQQALSSSQASLKETRVLLERGIVARMEADALQQQVSGYQRELASAQEQLHDTQQQGQGESLLIAEMELANAQAHHQSLSRLYEQRDIKAPFAAVVMRPLDPQQGKPAVVQSGQPVVQGSPLLTLANPRQLEVVSRVEEGDLHLLHQGMAVRVRGDAFAGVELAGYITRIGLRSTRLELREAAWYELVVTLAPLPDGLEETIRLGMSARINIVLNRGEGTDTAPQLDQ